MLAAALAIATPFALSFGFAGAICVRAVLFPQTLNPGDRT